MSFEEMSSQIVIPVTPFILSLFNECKQNLKYGDKSDADFLIFLLNSSMHIFSIVKEFSPILQDAIGTNNVIDSQLKELERKSSEFSSPIKPFNEMDDDVGEDREEDDDDEGDGQGDGDDDGFEDEDDEEEDENNISLPNLPLEPIIKVPDTTYPDKTCKICFATFATNTNLQRHLINKSCKYHLKRANLGSDILCPDCGKGYTSEKSLRRHLKRSKICGQDDLLSMSMPVKLPSAKTTTSKPYECTFCHQQLNTYKTYQQHKSKFRCPRRCKYCDYTNSRCLYVLKHMMKEHGTSMTLEQIEQYTRDQYNEHMAKESENGKVSSAVHSNGDDSKEKIIRKSPVLKLKRKSGAFTVHPLLKMAKLSSKATEETDEDEFSCKLCDFKASSHKSLAGHMSIHSKATKISESS